MASGYCNCACRDCFEIAIGDQDWDTTAPICHACEEAGCADRPGFPDCECLSDSAYGGEGVQS